MNFSGWQARFRCLQNEHATWKLLRADNAPIILAFITDLFAEGNEVPFARARIALDTELKRGRELGYWQSESGAGIYLNQWIRAGWLREMDDMLSKTDASETALRFCRTLDEPAAGTSASHLRIVQEAVRDFAVAVNPDLDERVAQLEQRQQEIQHSIDDLRAGVSVELSETEQRERIREIYQLASVLTGDFRRVEDDIRRIDKDLRIQIIEGDSTRGNVLLKLMEKEILLANTDAGNAFEGFFQLLCDQNRSTEFSDQLRGILSLPVAHHLNPAQRQFLARLMRELSCESERVFRIRRRTEEGLRGYIESGVAQENRVVMRLLSELERSAIALRENGCDLKTQTRLELQVGVPGIRSPESLNLRQPDENLDTSGVEEQANRREPSMEILDSLEAVQIRRVAERTLDTLRRHGPMTISALSRYQPLQAGLEELVACMRVARAVHATDLNTTELVEVYDKQGVRIRASIPGLLMSADLFPANIDELTL